ncbi:hypothetical protein ACYSTU_03325 [Pseudomonas glycinis]
MADYINKNILAQSYVHVEPKWLSQVSNKERLRQVDVIKSQITQYANERMQFFLHDGVVITVDFQEGSIIAKITAYGSIMALLGGGVGHALDFTEKFPAYKEGVKTIVTDVGRLADSINSEVLFQTKSREKKEIIRTEARKGVFGSLEKINNKIGEIERCLEKRDSKPSVVMNHLLDVNKYTMELFDNVQDVDDRALLKSALLDGVKSLKITRARLILKTAVDKALFDELLKEKRRVVSNIQRVQVEVNP